MSGSVALLVTADDVLLDDLLRLAAAAGVVLEVAHDVDSAVRGWMSSSVVLVAPDLLTAVAERRPVRRDRVHVVGHAPVADDLVRAALVVGAEQVAELPAAETWLVELLTDVADGARPDALTVGVVGGCGGAGATTFAAALATVAASPDRPAVLLDTDPLGGGAARVAGLDEVGGVHWGDLVGGAGRLASRALRDALPHRDGLSVLSWGGEQVPVDGATMREVLSAAQRGHATVVIDLPRHLDDVTLDLVGRSDHVVVVSGVTVPAVAASGRLVQRLRAHAREIHLLTRGRGGSVTAEQAAELLDVPLLATMADQRGLGEAVDLGLGPVRARRGPLARAARRTLAHLCAAAVAR